MFTFKPIVAPKGTLSAAKYRHAVQTARGIAETAGLQEARGITRGWRHKPKWAIERHGDDSDIVTSDEIFSWQDRGTKGPYSIRPRKKRALSWAGAAHPVRSVMHPGLKAQHFTEQIATKMQKHYQRIMDDEMQKAAP